MLIAQARDRRCVALSRLPMRRNIDEKMREILAAKHAAGAREPQNELQMHGLRSVERVA